MSAGIFIGIDPGQSGALAVIDRKGKAYAIPYNEQDYLDEISQIAAEGCEVRAIVEHVASMPKQGIASTFKFGANFGWIQGVLAANRIPYELVRPQKWKRVFSCTSDKNTSIAVAQRLFPTTSLLATPRCKKPHDGIAEALLMAEYGRRTLATMP